MRSRGSFCRTAFDIRHQISPYIRRSSNRGHPSPYNPCAALSNAGYCFITVIIKKLRKDTLPSGGSLPLPFTLSRYDWICRKSNHIAFGNDKLKRAYTDKKQACSAFKRKIEEQSVHPLPLDFSSKNRSMLSAAIPESVSFLSMLRFLSDRRLSARNVFCFPCLYHSFCRLSPGWPCRLSHKWKCNHAGQL